MRRAGSKNLHRSAGTRETFRRVFVACEGHRSEIDYLRELLRQSEVLGLHGRVEVIILDRYETDSGLSYPSHVIQMTADHMRYLSTGECSVRMFLSMVRSSAGENGRSAVKALSHDPMFEMLCTGDRIGCIEEATEYAIGFMHKRGFDVSLDFDDQMYDPRTDVVCIIIDRDAGKARPRENYQEFIESCDEKGFRLFVTNPKFEFWVLMHLDNIHVELMAIAGDRNPSAATDRVMESRGLSKGDIDFEMILGGLDTAMEHSKEFLLTPDRLEDTVGTNLPKFIDLLK